MKLSELVERLTEILEDGDRDVRIAFQPSWPLAAEVANVWDPAAEPDPDEDDDLDTDEPIHSLPPLWIAAGEGLEDRDASPYAPRRAFGEDYV